MKSNHFQINKSNQPGYIIATPKTDTIQVNNNIDTGELLQIPPLPFKIKINKWDIQKSLDTKIIQELKKRPNYKKWVLQW